MAAELSITPILEQFPGLGPIRQAHPLANAGGFSGSMLWRVEREAGDLCLRRWPREHPTEEGLVLIHGVLLELGKRGLGCLPVPRSSRDCKTFVSHAGNFWELAPWLPGKADFREHPSRSRLANVVETLARIHLVTEATSPPLVDVCPTLLSRREQLHRLASGGADQLATAVERHGDSQLQSRGRRLLSHLHRRVAAAAAALESVRGTPVPLFPVIRDLWHDHVLFSGDLVTGIVDFGALRVDSVACDLSRLLGSLVGNDREAWEFARCAYHAVRPLSADEWKLASALDEANVILAGLNWLEWICVQGRVFENQAAIQARLDEMLVRLEGR